MHIYICIIQKILFPDYNCYKDMGNVPKYLHVKENGRDSYDCGDQVICTREVRHGGFVHVTIQRTAQNGYDVFPETGNCAHLT